MPRILVADDNSNIQRMVALALKDAGIDVVAVGNGEAAVRKLPEAKPDLVLADIFMPVRSGYEVCEFIKNDPRYSHLPVVLLVGAFDPLDEREAQRVGADGILKKPFVPPDPLINMVKDLLAKSASERLVAVAVPVAVSASSASSAEAAAPPPMAYPPKRPPLPPIPDFNDPPTEEFAAPVGRVDFGKHDSPVAFSELLAAPALDDADLTVTASRDPVLGEPAWNHLATTQETTEDAATEDHSWGAHAQPLPLDIAGPALPSAEREMEPPAFGEISALPAIEFGGGERAHTADPSLADLESSFPEESAAAEKMAHAEEASATPQLEIVRGAEALEPPALHEPAAHESTVHEIELPELLGMDDQPWDTKPPVAEAANEDVAHHAADSAPEALPAWLAKVSPIFPPHEASREPEAGALDTSELASLAEIHAALPSVPEHDEHVEHAADTEHSEHADHAESSAVEYSAVEQVEVEPGVTDEDETEHGESESEASEHDLIQPDAGEPEVAWPAAVPTLAASSLAEIVHDSASHAEAEAASLANTTSEHASHPAEETAVMPSAQPPDPEMIEAIVTRIVERMQPKVFDVVTREILRPLVEALVNREIGKNEIIKH